MSDNNFNKGPHAARNKISPDIIDGKISGVDERKTVVLDEDLENVEFDDKVWLYWKRNRNFIMLTLFAALLIVVGTQGWKMYSASVNAELASAYEAASANGTLADFAKTNAGAKLSGVALMENADKFYNEAKYTEAKADYQKAQSALKSTILFGRVKLGEAVCEYMISKKSGKTMLEGVFNDASIDGSYRAQAGYMLAQAQLAEGDKAAAKTVLENIAKNPKNGIFARIASEELSRM